MSTMKFSQAWLAAEHVRVDSLRPGDRFVDCQGSERVYQRRDASSGVHHTTDGNLYAGCAEVVKP